ncbi:MAG TPA: hypothetical protein VFO83_16085, partial [Aggregicoccus sp.]|nr:hypothetical protein [Aggregicoccus sp.]
MSTPRDSLFSACGVVLLAALAATGCAHAPSPAPAAAATPTEPPPDAARIQDWEDRRAPGELQVLTLSAQDP